MTIEYHIIWVDDSPEWVDSVKEDIELHLTDHGFKARITHHKSGASLNDACNGPDLDLIIVDYHLPDDTTGDQIISRLRSGGVFKEIVFYSQSGTTTQRIGATDGVFHSDREGAVDTIKRVIDLTVHKMRDVEVVRGLIIATTLDLESQIESLLITLFGAAGNLFREKVVDKLYLDFQKKFTILQSHVKDVESATRDAQKKARLSELKAVLARFSEEVIDQRNILAHVKKEIGADGKPFLKALNKRAAHIRYDENWLRKFRVTLANHELNLRELERWFAEG